MTYVMSFMNDDAAKRPQPPVPFPINPSRLYLSVHGLVYIYIEAATEIIFVLQRQYCAHNFNRSVSLASFPGGGRVAWVRG